ncbi:MAG TPA: DHA2 family efflux MFS transporter permease subunit [Candidatus Limnocylindria bacterium]|jgi:DHA2 family multidrug resistance protein|nr:DHA2 family efflux MFS transporter permease subunit [Candidatus Limnocylindria bacterium]
MDAKQERAPGGRVDVIEYGWRRAAVTLAVIVAAMIEIIDTTIVNVALPTIQGNLGADVEQAAWVVTGYIIANVIVIPLTPWLQTRFGRRNYFVASIVVFTLASLLCGISNDLAVLVAFRILQGLAGGGLISTAQTILADTYPREQQGLATGIFAMGVIVGPAVGPVLGGFLTDQLSWRWAFFVNLPIGTLAAILAATMLRDPEKPRSSPIDLVGLGLLITGLGSLQYVLDQGQVNDWFSDPAITAFACLSAVGLVAFVLWELFGTRHPIVDLRVLRYAPISIGSAMSVVLGFTLFGGVLLIPQYSQSVLGFTATMSGQLFLVQAGTSGILTFVSVAILGSGKVQARYLVALGFVLLGLGNWLLFHVETPQTDFHAFVIPLMTLGLGMSQIFVPMTVASVGAVPEAIVPAASAFTNLARQLGGSVSTALLVTIAQRGATSDYAALAQSIRLDRPGVAHYVASQGGEHVPGLVPNLFGMLASQSAVLGYAEAALITAVVSVLLAPLALVMRDAHGHEGGAPRQIEIGA